MTSKAIDQRSEQTAGRDILNLEGRVGVVTGGGQGVGRRIALHFAEHGAGGVVVNDFYAERAESVAAEVEKEGVKALPLRADVTDFEAVSAMFEKAREVFGRVDILVNNAGNAGPEARIADVKPFWETPPQEWAPWIDVNFNGVLNCTHAALQAMVPGGYGRITTLISDAGRVGEPHLVVYSGAKAAAAGFTRGLARAVGRYGITANCVALGSVRTPTTESVLQDEDLVKKMLRGYIVRRVGEPEDVANLVLFLCSDAASWITGQTYPVNGGYSLAV